MNISREDVLFHIWRKFMNKIGLKYIHSFTEDHHGGRASIDGYMDDKTRTYECLSKLVYCGILCDEMIEVLGCQTWRHQEWDSVCIPFIIKMYRYTTGFSPYDDIIEEIKPIMTDYDFIQNMKKLEMEIESIGK